MVSERIPRGLATGFKRANIIKFFLALDFPTVYPRGRSISDVSSGDGFTLDRSTRGGQNGFNSMNFINCNRLNVIMSKDYSEA